jgi:hypothetical protein
MSFAERVQFTLSPEERNLIMNHAVAVEQSIVERLRFGVREGRRLGFRMAVDELGDFVDALASESHTARSRKLRRRFSRVYKRLANLLDSHLRDRYDPVSGGSDKNEFHRLVRNTLQSREFADIDEANEALRHISEEHNRRSQSDLQGLSPLQVTKLIYLDWNTPDAGVSLSRGLDIENINSSELFTNARTFLRALNETGGAKATVAGNLNRKFVLQMAESMRWPPDYIEKMYDIRKVWNEEDLFPLHTLRIVTVLAGLARKYKGSFRITKRGQQFLNEKNGGLLFELLFRTFFRKFNLSYLDDHPECPGIQQTMGFSLYALGKYGDDWTTPAELAEKLFLPSVAAEIPFNDFGFDYATSLAKIRLLLPLERFGLVECRRPADAKSFFAPIEHVRKTPLFDNFIRFDLSNS